MRSRRVILRFLPLGLVAVLLGSVMVWQDSVERRLGDDVNAAPQVVVSEHDVPVVAASEPESAENQTAPKAEPSKPSPRTVAELAPTKIKPFSMVGVTWRSGVPNDSAVEVRWRQDDAWTKWTELHLDVQNTWTEGGRPGTEAQWVDHADGIAVRVRSNEPATPRDLRVTTIDPGRFAGTTPVASVDQPPIILRSSWGAKADSGCDSPRYGSTTRGAVIHHTAGSNSYTKSDSASIVRATQAYHMNGRDWCDIGYNFLIDKYGQIFEGRSGGIDKPVRGAHAGNGAVNEETMGVSLMGTFTSTTPSSAMKAATVALVAWRFSDYGILAKGTYSLGGLTLNRIAGHRNVVSTECPGARVYSWLSASGGLRDRVEDMLQGGGSQAADVPTGLTSIVQWTTALKFAWNEVPGAPEYQIRLSASSSMSSPRYQSSAGVDEWFSGLKPDTDYYAQVRTLDDDGSGLSAFSTPVKATTRPVVVDEPDDIDPADHRDTGNLYTLPSTYADGATIAIAANFPSGVFDVTYYEETSTGTWKSIGTDESNSSGNAYLSGYEVSGSAKVFALAESGGRTEVDTVTPTPTATAASATGPKAPGDFTGYGFDACVAPSQTVMDAWNLRSPYTAIGIYVSGSSRYCGDEYQPNLNRTWVEKNASHGWRFIPIHVGYQSPCFTNNPKSRVQKKKMSSSTSTASKQGASDANETIAALKKYGFGPGSVSYLDLEWYKRTTSCDNAVLAFIDAWTDTLHDAGYKSGVYSSGSAAIAVLDDAKAGERRMSYPDQIWIAWTNKVADTDGGSYVRDSFWDDHQRIHQYHNNVNVTYGGHAVTIDKDFLDVGKGSVATKEPKPCDVAMSFSSYPRLQQGDTGSRVSALQCLLKESGQSVKVDGTFGSSTAEAIDAFRKSLGWGPTAGHTTDSTWTALLSAGSKPRVLKRGSVGDAVWRLQRGLSAAGMSVSINGVYDSRTVSAVKAYRSANGLTSYETAESSVWSLLQHGKLG